MRNLRGKTAYITGGSSGIGLAIAGEMIAAGARVALIARSEKKLRDAREQLTGAAAHGSPAEITHRALDVGDRRATEERLPELVTAFGPPDILVNCHGKSDVRYFHDLTYESLMELFRVNVGGSWNTIQILLPELEKKQAVVVNVASVAGFVGVLGYSAYSASKFGLIGLSEVLRNELKPRGVRVQVLCPPDTDTPGFASEQLTSPYETKSVSGIVPVKSSEYVARALMRGLRRRKFLIVPGFMGRLTLFVKGVAPRIVFGVTDSDLRKARRKMARESG